MAPPKKTVAQYEAEAQREGECLISPLGQGVARRVYVLRHGPLPSHIAVCHTCDNTHCIEDSHHFPGTWKDNVRDSVQKGRHSCFQNCAKTGEKRSGFGADRSAEATAKISAGLKRAYEEGRRSNSRLTPEIIPEIRAAKGSLRQVGEKYGISRHNVWQIRMRRTWSWI